MQRRRSTTALCRCGKGRIEYKTYALKEYHAEGCPGAIQEKAKRQVSGKILNLAGLALNLIGVLILFRYGMPFHVPSGGAVHLILEQTDQAEIELERRYKLFGYIGLALLIAGTILQMVATWHSG
jgi:hypothetical protein